ncbi:hypothetical protein [Mesorhizobium huakuii]|uniref:Uncharacterized protein n=1 Tax=Mesorhizobium huakuii TaxID=28104 RepID=A0ABZ0VQA8_9HYPH|nr:hypothetical protein [Mesorhizobium huakuii]WQB99662.1 hypothetical protein U0R22_003850 [Mesorhizobium huakuii]
MPTNRFQVGNDLEQQEIAIAKLVAYAREIIRCRCHLLDVTKHVAFIADSAMTAQWPPFGQTLSGSVRNSSRRAFSVGVRLISG